MSYAAKETAIRAAIGARLGPGAIGNAGAALGFVPSSNPGEIRLGIKRDLAAREICALVQNALEALSAAGFRAGSDLTDIVIFSVGGDLENAGRMPRLRRPARRTAGRKK